MTTLRTDIQTFLLTRAKITAAVGTNVFWLKAPQSQTSAFIVYQKISANRKHDLADLAYASAPRWQIDGYTKTIADVEALDEAIRSLGGYTGAVGSTTVQWIEHVDDRDDIARLLAGSDVSWIRVSHDFNFHFHETIPTP